MVFRNLLSALAGKVSRAASSVDRVLAFYKAVFTEDPVTEAAAEDAERRLLEL